MPSSRVVNLLPGGSGAGSCGNERVSALEKEWHRASEYSAVFSRGLVSSQNQRSSEPEKRMIRVDTAL